MQEVCSADGTSVVGRFGLHSAVGHSVASLPTPVQAECVEEADAIAAVAEEWAAEIKQAQQVGWGGTGL